ncbi:MAG: aldo/keto reductase [Bacteroidales bacterium]|nr:aldo/keto reductase [Bacteroidales bacterium]
MENKDISRRNFLKVMGAGAVSTAALSACRRAGIAPEVVNDYSALDEPPVGQMTYRRNPKTGEQVSLLGYGMMRLPVKGGGSARESKEVIDQEQVNRLVDYAIEHGVNYFDTSPTYCQGNSETATGIALHRHPRNSYYVATKLSNFAPATWPREESMKMYRNSFHQLQVEYIDYYLLHGIGMGGMDNLRGRYLDNGMLDFLVAEREAGRIRNLGFSYHGDVNVFNYLLSQHDKYHWDFVQIELNYLDWDYANEINDRNTDARYLYGELQKLGIPSVIMEPLLGGRLANLPQYLAAELKRREPQKTLASWAFRYAGTPEGVLTVLSGMTYMEHLKDNLLSYCPLQPVSSDEENFLYHIAEEIAGMETIPCNDCKYCMPCPYGVNIPAIFVHYNKCKNEGTLPTNPYNADYARLRRQYLIDIDRTIPSLRQASHCIGCHQCEEHCPANIRISYEMDRIDKFIDNLKRNGIA